jgi:hypothetical protein
MDNSALNRFLREEIRQNRDTDVLVHPDGKNMVYTYSREKLLSTEADEDLIDKLSPTPQSRYIYRWNNGRVGAIYPEADGHLLKFREYKIYDGPDDTLSYPKGIRPVIDGDEDNEECKELLAAGIVAYYLIMRNQKGPKDIFTEYLDDDIKVFWILRDAEMRAWDPEYKKEFPYSEHLKRERHYIRVSSKIFEFLSEEEVNEIKIMTNNYFEFVRNRMPIEQLDIIWPDWEETKQCFKAAVLRLMEWKKKKCGYLFEKNTQWKAVYRFAVDIGIMYDDDDPSSFENTDTAQYKMFTDFAHELQFDVSPPFRMPFDYSYIENLKKKSYSRYNIDHSLWSKNGLEGNQKGLTLYKELDDAYKALEKEFYFLLRQATKYR